jgi:hypothetical protein
MRAENQICLERPELAGFKVESEQTSLTLPAVATAGSLTLFRYTSYDVPFWVRPNSRSGRWHVSGDPPTQYWSMTPDAAWAELIRSENLRTEAELDELRMPIWACRYPASNLVDFGEHHACERLGISATELVADDCSPCQALGRRLRIDSCPGVIAPCVALDGHWNVTLFGARRQIDWRDRPALARTVPATVVSVGRPRRNLINEVRRRLDLNSPPALF